MADIEASKPRAQLVHHADLPQRERGAPRVAEQFWRQAATRKDRPPSKRRPHTLPRSKRKSLPLALKRWGQRRTGRAAPTAAGGAHAAASLHGSCFPSSSHAALHVLSNYEHNSEDSLASPFEHGQHAALLSAVDPAVRAQQAGCRKLLSLHETLVWRSSVHTCKGCSALPLARRSTIAG